MVVLAVDAAAGLDGGLPWAVAYSIGAAMAGAIVTLLYLYVKAQDARVGFAEKTGEARITDVAKTATVVAESTAQLARMAERVDRVLEMLDDTAKAFARYIEKHP